MARPGKVVDIAIRGDMIELHQFLKLAGVVASGGAGKALVAAGEVVVDGQAEARKTRKLAHGNVVGVGPARYRVVATPAPATEASR